MVQGWPLNHPLNEQRMAIEFLLVVLWVLDSFHSPLNFVETVLVVVLRLVVLVVVVVVWVQFGVSSKQWLHSLDQWERRARP